MSLYDVPYLLAAPVLGAPMAWKRWRHGKYRDSLPAMLGRGLPSDRRMRLILAQPNRPVWLHAVSVGEVVAARALLRALRLRLPDYPLIVSTTTETGQAHARATLDGLADLIFYAPLDFSWIVRRFAAYYAPAAYVAMETELWPNLLCEMRRRGVPAFLINGRLNERSFRGYRRVRWALGPALRAFRACLMQTPADARRLIALGVDPRRVLVMGNCKFDALPDPMPPGERRALRMQLGWSDEDFVLVAGSTHDGEENAVLEAIGRLRAEGRTRPALRLVLAPRHPERFEDVARLVEQAGLRLVRFSDREAELTACSACDAPERMGRAEATAATAAPLPLSHHTTPAPATGGIGGGINAPPDVLLLDAMGRLARWFGVGDAAFVGGSLTDKVGGHNLLEPAAHGVPVLHGPHMFKQPEIMKIIRRHQASLETTDLAAALRALMTDAARRTALADAARRAAASTRGSAARAAAVIARTLGAP
ncbi:MAG: 3-deoxy-D-manno-octulosonic acid transferase [Candidatus Sumerlaeia bacterium]